MKKSIFAVLLFSVLVFSCTQEATEKFESPETANSIVQRQSWKRATISSEIIENQKNISHYEFDVKTFQTLLDSEEVTYVWFDLGLNENNQITFTATGENNHNVIIGQVGSKIIATQNYTADFSIFNEIEDVPLEEGVASGHILENQKAYQYLTSMEEAYYNFEERLNREEQRVERFGMEAISVKRMLATKNIHSLALFLGNDTSQKITTVFIGKDTHNHLLIDASSNNLNAGRAYDLVVPAPPFKPLM